MDGGSKSKSSEELIWTREEPSSRRRGYNREQIAAAALEIADAEGFEAVSMRRVAAKLGAGTMTLYHYVRNKDELVSLMDNAIMGEVVVPEGELPVKWREALMVIARRTREAFVRHPWSIDSLRGANGGPNGMRHVEQSLEAVEGTGLPVRERLELINMVDDYVFGFVIREIMTRAWTGEDEPVPRPEAWGEALIDYFGSQLESGDYPRLTALLGGTDGQRGIERLGKMSFDKSRFERGLGRLLDGVELDLKRRKRKS